MAGGWGRWDGGNRAPVLTAGSAGACSWLSPALPRRLEDPLCESSHLHTCASVQFSTLLMSSPGLGGSGCTGQPHPHNLFGALSWRLRIMEPSPPGTGHLLDKRAVACQGLGSLAMGVNSQPAGKKEAPVRGCGYSHAGGPPEGQGHGSYWAHTHCPTGSQEGPVTRGVKDGHVGCWCPAFCEKITGGLGLLLSRSHQWAEALSWAHISGPGPSPSFSPHQ